MLTQLTKTNSGRTISHAALAFLGALLPQLGFTSTATFKAVLMAAVPGALAAAYRVVAPNPPTAPAPPAH